jgi:hypothetical protein
MRARVIRPIVPALVGALWILSVCTARAQVADAIYHGGPILTMDGEAPT